MKSKLISLSAVSAAFVAIALTLGIYFEFIVLVSLVIASAFVILPLYYKSFLAGVLSYLAGGVIALIFTGFNFMSIVFPAYFLFFGLYPLIKVKFFNKKLLILIIGVIWCVAAFYGMYYYYTELLGLTFTDLPNWALDYVEYIPYLVAPVGIIFYFIFDRYIAVIKIFTDKYLSRIIK